jgi:magnesium transporter
MTEHEFYHFPPSGSVSRLNSPIETIAAGRSGGFIWLKFVKPEKEDFSSLISLLGIHPLSVEDCLNEKQLPKIEHFPTNTFIIFNSFTYEGKELWIDEVDFFIGENYLITVSGQNSESRRPLKEISRKIINEKCYERGGPAFLMQNIIDYLVDNKFEAIETAGDDLEEAEEDLINHSTTFDPGELVRLRRYLLLIRKSLYHEREILIKICRLDSPFISGKAIFHYRDIYDHLAKFFELAETYREIVTSLMELYTSLLNNQMTKASNATNSSVRRLTIITTIFMPLTLLASIGGMSEWTMMTGEENWRISYPLFFAGLAVVAVLNLFLILRLEKRNYKTRDVNQI